MKNTPYCVFFLLCCFLFFIGLQTITAQSNAIEVNAPPAPEAAAFGKFGDIPVGEFTGSAQINVPIYTLAHRGFSLPIGLSYHSNGIRVSEEAGWVGLGWSLNTGGMITRAVRGFDDFGTQRWTPGCDGTPNDYINYWTLSTGGGIPTGFSEHGEYIDTDRYLQLAQNNISIDQPGPTSPFSVTESPYQIGGNSYSWDFFCQYGENVKDLESDLYTYNILGYSGKFIIGNDGNIVFLEASDLKFEQVTVNGEDDVRWVFITPQGMKVYLGSTRESRQLTYSTSRSTTETDGQSTPTDIFGIPCNQAMDSYISTWYIDKVELPTGEQVNFTYVLASDALYYPVPAFSANMRDKVGGDFTTSGGTPDSGELPDRIYGKTTTLLAYDNIYLSSISLPAINEEIIFTIQENRDDLLGGILLDELTVYRGGAVYKSFDFSFDYFDSLPTSLAERWEDDFYGSTDAPTRLVDEDGDPVIEFDATGLVYYAFKSDLIGKRLRLNAVQEKGSDGSSQIPAFTFTYNGGLPVKTSYAVDLWGHYNGQHGNRSFVPAASTNQQEYILLNCSYTSVNDNLVIADRDAYFPYTEAGLLRSVRYPTGGETELSYEANQYIEAGTSIIDETVETSITYLSGNPCASETAPTPVSFVYNDNNPDGEVGAFAFLKWEFKECVPEGCNSANCLRIDNGQPFAPAGGFFYRLENSTGQLIYSWNWTEVLSELTVFSSGDGDYYKAGLAVPITGLVDGETYYLKIEQGPGIDLAPNLTEAKFTLNYYVQGEAPVIYELSGDNGAQVKVTNAGYCEPVPPPTPVPFIIDDQNGNTSSCVRVELNWVIDECAGLDCDAEATCFAVGGTNEVEIFEVSFRYVIVDDQGQDVISWNWNNGSGGILSSPTVTNDEPHRVFSSFAAFDISALEEGRTYYLKIESFAGSDMPVNLRTAQMKITWPEFEAQAPGEGGGVRIATTTDKTNGQVAQTKSYQYITPSGQPSGQLYKEPIHYFFSTQGRVSTRQVQSAAFNSVFSFYSHTFYLNRLSSSVTPLSSSYSGSFVNYSHVRIDYGGGANGYVDKTFFRSDTKLITSDFKDYSLPLFYNQRNGSILSEKYHSATGNLVRENRYRYNDDWGGLYSALSADSRFAPQYGYRVLSPRFTVSYALDNVPSFSRSCSEGLAGPEIFPYAEAPQWHYLQDMTTREYGEDGSFTETVTEYEYEDIHFNRIEEKISGTGIEWTTKYKYAEELGSCILNDHMTAIPLEVDAPNGVTYLTTYNCALRVPVTFKETYQDGSSIIRSEVTQFGPNGYPRSIARFGFTADENYTWKASPAPEGLLESKSYLAWEEEFEYNDFRQLERTIAIDEQPVEYEYDPHGRLYQVKARPASVGGSFNILTTMTYDMGGPNIITQETVYSDAPAQTNQSYFDGLGRPTKTVINGVTKQETLYDGIGRVSASTYLPGSFTSFSYDGSPLNRLTRETYPDGNSVQFRYNAEDNEWVTTRINEREFPTKNYTDILGRQSKMEDAIGNITDHGYDGFGRLVSIASPAGSYGYVYDDRNRLISKSVPDAGAVTYCYDDATDLLCSSIDANGNRLSSEFDAYQRDTTLYLETGADTDCNCNTSGDLMIANQYDGLGVGQEANPIYLGKLSASQATMLGASGQTETEFVLDEFGRIERKKDKITIDGSVVNARQVHTLNQADWLLNTQNTVNGIANGASYDQAFNYDDFGRVVFENSAGVNVQMRYNDQDQMVYKLYDGGLSRQDYEYNVRGWLTDINILRPEVFTEEDLSSIVIPDPCQPLTGEDDSYVVNQQVPPAEFFELLCSGYDITVPDVDVCPPVDPEGCLTDYFDSRYENLILNPSVFYSDSREHLDFFQNAKEQCDKAGGNLCFPYGFKIKRIEDIDGNVIPLGYDYDIINTYDMDVSCLDDINILTEVDELRNDLTTWLDDNGYDYDEVNINVIWDNPDEPSSPIGATRAFRLQFEILGSLNFQLGEITTEYLIYCVDVEKGAIIDEYSLLKTEEAEITVTTINNCGPIGVYPSPGVSQGGNTAADFEAAIQNTNPASVSLPAKLYEVITSDDHKLWMLEDELLSLTSSYLIHDIIYLNTAQETFDVTKLDGQVMTTDVAGLLTQRSTDVYLGEIEPTISQGGGNGTFQGGGGTNCPPDPLGCDSATEAAQQQSLDDICAETLELFADEAISYPFSVSVVQLCNGDITYVLTDLVGDITGNHQILNTFLIDEEGLDIEVRIEEAFFAMQFDHQPNGNIEQVKWKVSNRATSIYDYSYDEIDRVLGSSYSEEYFLDETITTPQGLDYVSRTLTVDPNNRYNTTFGYSGAGNITTIWRNGVGYTCGPEGQIDKLTLSYRGAGNRLLTVEDEAEISLRQYGFRPHPSPNHGTLEYQYDDNGNMTNDPHKLLDITYNHLNLPEQVRKGSTDVLTTVYDATGRKWKKTSTVDILDEYNQPSGSTYTETRVYVNGVEFSGEGTGASQIASINASSNGRVAYNYDTSTGAPAGSRVEYYHTDHLGNVRLAFSDLDGDGAITVQDIYDPTNEITQERHYYPYGLTHTGAWFATVSPEDQYRYNGKELDEATGHYFYGFRMYDPAIGRFTGVDPIADQFAFVSPYNYAENKPINAIDLHGLQAFFVHGTASDSDTWTQNDQQIPVLLELSGNQTYNADFNWPEGTNGFRNDQSDRAVAAQSLAEHVLSSLGDGEDITLIGHSHGGNVSIQAVDLIKEGLQEMGDERDVNLITLATPAYTGRNDSENPANTEVDSHIHFYSSVDEVQVSGSNFMGNKKANRGYSSPATTQNFMVQDFSYKKILGRSLKRANHSGSESHYIHMNVQYIKEIMDNGQIKK